MPEPLVLVVDDDLEILRMVGVLLSGEGYRFAEARDAYQALEMIHKTPPDVIVLDWMMPGLSGWDLVRRLRAEQATRGVPIIMLTAKTEEKNVVAGLRAGADDYITKPFSGGELVARIDALFRRARSDGGSDDSKPISIGAITLDPSEHRLSVEGHELRIGPTEFRLLAFFMRNPNKVFTRSRILDNVWGARACVEERTVDVQIRRLRKALESYGHGEFIETVRGVGYRLKAAPNA